MLAVSSISRFLPMRSAVIALFLGVVGNLSAQAPDAGEDIRGAKPLVEIPLPEKPPYELWLGFGGGLFLIVIGWFIWRSYRGKRRMKGPREIALASLSDLESRTDAMPAEAFAYQAAKCVRQYIADRFGLAAPRRTTEEFFRDLAKDETSSLMAESDHLRSFLKSCDLAKFAGSNLDSTQRHELVEAARRFVRSTSQAVTP